MSTAHEARPRLQGRLLAQGGRCFADDRLTVAKLKILAWIRHLGSGLLDVPVDLAERVAPRLVEHHDHVKEQPAVKAYYAEGNVAI